MGSPSGPLVPPFNPQGPQWQLSFYPGIVTAVAATGVCFWSADTLATDWFDEAYVTIVPGGLELPAWLATAYGMTIPPAPVLARSAGDLAATEAADSASFDGWAQPIGALATTENTDTASFAGHIPASGALAVVENTDVSLISGIVFFPSHGALATTEAADAASFAGSIR